MPTLLKYIVYFNIEQVSCWHTKSDVFLGPVPKLCFAFRCHFDSRKIPLRTLHTCQEVKLCVHFCTIYNHLSFKQYFTCFDHFLHKPTNCFQGQSAQYTSTTVTLSYLYLILTYVTGLVGKMSTRQR